MYKFCYLIIVALLFGCKSEEDYKIVDGWTILFDGSSYNHWRGFQQEEMPEEWIIDEAAMAYIPNEEGGNTIVTKRKFTNFELSLEWKISKTGNSGVFWGVNEGEKYSVAYQTGPEVQIRDNEMSDNVLVLPKHRAGAIFDIIAPSEDVTKPVGEWNHCLITINYKTNRANVAMNNVEVLDFPLEGKEWNTMLENSKFIGWDGFASHKTGHIALQDHGNNVWYRNIKLKEL